MNAASRAILVAATLAASIVSAPACDRAERDSVALMNEGVRAMDRRDYNGALKFLTRAVEVDRTNPDAQFELGQLYILSDKTWYSPRKALEHLKIADTLRPNDRDVLFNIARVEMKAGDPEVAKGYLDRVIALDANHEGAWYFKGKYLHDSGDHAGADKAWREAIAIDPTKARGFAAVGQMYEDVEADDAATAIYEEGLKHTGNDTELLGNLARLRLRSGEYKAAVGAFAEVARREEPGPLQNAAMFNLASAFASWADVTAEDKQRELLKAKALVSLQSFIANADPDSALYESAIQFRRQLRAE